MKILSAKQMARLDRLSIQKYKIPARRLMGNAAKRVLEVLCEYSESKKPGKTLIVCGPGNNGGDGFALAGFLQEMSVPAECYFWGKLDVYSPEAKFYLSKLKTPPVNLRVKQSEKTFKKALKESDWVVDALFGTGLNRPLKGWVAKLITAMNAASGSKLAIDMPSGISGDTGKVLGKAFRAEITVTFEVPKLGQVMESAWDFVGILEARSIGLSKKALSQFPSSLEWIYSGEIRSWFKKRSKDMNKGKAGKVLVVAGSQEMPGAGYLSALGALRAGAGLVTWALPDALRNKIEIKSPEVILRYLPASEGKFGARAVPELLKLKSGFKAMALGPGLGRGGELPIFLKSSLRNPRYPKVLDADALNLLSESPAFLKSVKGCILTPHIKEMSRLVKKPVQEIKKNRIKIAKAFAKKFQVWLVLKSYRSIIAGPKGELFINSVGGPNLAVAGSGDVLTGVIAALLAQGFQPGQAAIAGAYLHGRAGDLLARRMGDRGSLASEIASEIPLVIKELV